MIHALIDTTRVVGSVESGGVPRRSAPKRWATMTGVVRSSP